MCHIKMNGFINILQAVVLLQSSVLNLGKWKLIYHLFILVLSLMFIHSLMNLSCYNYEYLFDHFTTIYHTLQLWHSTLHVVCVCNI